MAVFTAEQIRPRALDPKWEETTRVHDWRNYIGDRVRVLWNTFTDEQKVALALDADELAGAEEWD